MKRGIIIAVVALWALVALTAVGFLVAYWNGGNHNLINLDFGIGVGTKLLKEESLSPDGVNELEILTSYDGIELVKTNGTEFSVTQYGRENAAEGELFKANIVGNKIIVSTKQNNRVRIGIFLSAIGEEKLVVQIPESWKGSVTLETSSGSVRLPDKFSFDDVSIRTTSGGVKLAKSIKAASLTLKSSSGSIRLEDGAEVTGDFESSSTSGSQVIDGFLKAGGGALMKSSSGSIRVRSGVTCGGKINLSSTSGSVNVESDITASSLEVGSSSGTIRLDKAYLSERFDLGCTSGSIHVGGLSGQGRIKSSSGSITAELMNPVGNVEASSTSGSVNLTVPSSLSFDFEANTSSGSIRADFELFFRSSRKNSAVGKVGDNPTALIKAEASSGSIRVNLR